MLSPNDPHDRDIVSQVVRRIAADTGYTTVARIGEDGEFVFAVRDSFVHGPDLGYADVLAVATFLEPGQWTPGPVSACALVLPDRHIAYIKHGTAPMTTLTVGPEPQDDPDTRREVEAGLTAFMQIHLDNQPAPRPTGRAFPGLPNGNLPNGSPQHHPPNGTPPQPGPDTHGPRR